MKRILAIFLIAFFVCFSFEVQAFPASSSTIYDGIDVSEWQGEIDFAEVKEAGIEVVYIRASEGSGYKDPYYLRNYEGAKDNGIKIGDIVISADNEEIEDILHLKEIINNKNVGDNLTLLIERNAKQQIINIRWWIN